MSIAPTVSEIIFVKVESVVALTWTHTEPWNADDWRSDAACRNTDPELFFPIGTTGLALSQIEEAKSVCMTCSGRLMCLDYAMATNQDSGVWGGTSEEDRRALRRQRALRVHISA